MTNEMKLLTALCEALGFEVVIKRDYQETKVPRKMAQDMIRHNQFFLDPGHLHLVRFKTKVETKSLMNTYVIDEDGNYTSMLVEPVISYELHVLDVKTKEIKDENSNFYE